MNVTSLFWFLAGALSASAVMFLVGGRLRVLGSQSRWVMAGCLAGVVAAAALYLKLGTPGAMLGAAAVGPVHGATVPVGATPGAAAGDAGSMDAVVAALESRLREKGGGDGDWELLAKSYEFLNRADAAAQARAHKLPAAGAVAAIPAATATQPTAASERLLADAEAARMKRDFSGAAKIYAQLVANRQMTADAWADYADVSASLNGNALTGKPAEYLRNALQLNPAHPKALWLQGSLEHESRQYAAAVTTWRKLLALMDAGSSDARLIQSNIEEDTRLMGGSVATSAPAGGLTLRGDVTVSRALLARVKAGQVLYVVAKSVNSPGMPLAVRRLQTGTWPLSFELSDGDAMVPERRLSAMGPVTVEARISQSGVANSAPGDLLGTTAPLDPARAATLHIVIDREVR